MRQRPDLCVGGRRREARAPLPTLRVSPAVNAVRRSRPLGQSRARRPTGCPARLTSTRSSPNASSTSERMITPATIVGARSGCRPGTARRSSSGVPPGARAAPRASRAPARGPRPARCRRARARDRSRAHEVAVPATPTAASTRARTSAGTAASTLGAHRGGERRAVPGRGRVRAQVALAVADDADLRRDVEAERAGGAADQLRRAAADVDHEQLGGVVRGPGRGRARERERGLLVAGQRAPCEPEAPAHAVREGARRWPRRAPRRSSPRYWPRSRGARSRPRNARASRTRAPAAPRRAARACRRRRRAG